EGVEPLVGRPNEGGMVGEAEVVVGAEVDHLAPAHADGRALGALDVALAFVEPAVLEVLELRPKYLTEMSVAHDGITGLQSRPPSGAVKWNPAPRNPARACLMQPSAAVGWRLFPNSIHARELIRRPKNERTPARRGPVICRTSATGVSHLFPPQGRMWLMFLERIGGAPGAVLSRPACPGVKPPPGAGREARHPAHHPLPKPALGRFAAPLGDLRPLRASACRGRRL